MSVLLPGGWIQKELHADYLLINEKAENGDDDKTLDIIAGCIGSIYYVE